MIGDEQKYLLMELVIGLENRIIATIHSSIEQIQLSLW